MNVQHPSGSRVRVTSSSPYFPAWTALVRGIPGRLCIIGGGTCGWSDTAQGYIMPWDPVLGWIEFHDDYTYEVVLAGPPREVVDSGAWSYV